MNKILILLWVVAGVAALIYVLKFVGDSYKNIVAERFIISLKMNLSKEEYETLWALINKAHTNMLEKSDKYQE